MKSRSLFRLSFAVATATVFHHACLAADPARAAPPQPAKQLILPGEVFTVGGRTAFLFTPAAMPERQATPKPGTKPWILYSPTLPSYPDKAEQWMHAQFTRAGVAKVAPAYGLTPDELLARVNELWGPTRPSSKSSTRPWAREVS